MIGGLLDTAIVIDLLRNYPPAIAWLQHQSVLLATTPLVWLEIIEGSSNKVEQTRGLGLLRRFDLVYLSDADFD